jgi:hypothetical protein
MIRCGEPSNYMRYPVGSSTHQSFNDSGPSNSWADVTLCTQAHVTIDSNTPLGNCIKYLVLLIYGLEILFLVLRIFGGKVLGRKREVKRGEPNFI